MDQLQLLAPLIPVHLLFSYISVVVTGGLLLLGLATPRRQASPSFLFLAASMALWQFAKLAKNDGLPFMVLGSRDFWSSLSFVGATFIYPSLFSLSLLLSGRKIRKWMPQILVGIISAVMFCLLFHFGYLTEGLRLEQYGWFNKPKPLYILYLIVYFIYMVSGIVLLAKRHGERIKQQYPSRLLFWAATLGFGFGSLEFYSILVEPIYPLADLSSAFYSGVFYWAIFRFNYLGGRVLMRWFILRSMIAITAFSIFFMALLALYALAPWFERPWVPAFLISLVLSALIPILFSVFMRIRKQLFPAHHMGRELLLQVSATISQSGNPIQVADRVLTEIQERFGYSRALLILYQSHPPGESSPYLISRGMNLTRSEAERLNTYVSGPITRSELLDQIRQFGFQGRLHRLGLIRDWRILRRSHADTLIPARSEEGLELLLLLKEGRYRSEDWSVTGPLLEGICQLLAHHLYLRRITETRIQEKHLGDLGLMAAGLAHEIKNPLEGIYGAAQILQEEEKGNHKFIEMILKDSMRLNDIVQNFLKFARPWPTAPTPFDLKSWIQNLVHEHREKGISIQLELPNESLVVLGDPASLHQVFTNLIQNAMRVQPTGIPIQLRVKVLRHKVHIEIQDQGPGITSDSLEHLFKPFFTTHAKGNGLGLALSRKICRAMKGDLFYTPSEFGAQFTVQLIFTDHTTPINEYISTEATQS